MNDWTQMIPGVYREQARGAEDIEFRTGVPVFLGLTAAGTAPTDEPVVLTRWVQFARLVASPVEGGYLAAAVRGFFENGGQRCVIVTRPAPDGALTTAALHERVVDSLRSLGDDHDVDLVCAPDLMLPLRGGGYSSLERLALIGELLKTQVEIASHCALSGHRVAILDSPPAPPGSTAAALADAYDHAGALRRAIAERDPAWRRDAALYTPWVGPERSAGLVRSEGDVYVPPCGHVAGVYARMDAETGVHKAPAGVALAGVCDLEVLLSDGDQAELINAGVNCLRAFRGRGLRIWGARTLSEEDEWRHVSVRRLVRTLARWLELRLADLTLENNDSMLWNRVTREVSAHLDELHAAGALRGRIPAEAYYVKCDAETNPPEIRDAGMMIAEIGLAPFAPQEFIAVRLVQHSEGLSLTDAANA